MGFRILIVVSFIAVLLLGGESIQYTIINNCSTTNWPATQTFIGSATSSGFELSPKSSQIIESGQRWFGRIWARTGCTNNGGYFTCLTGDCVQGTITCDGAGPLSPATDVQLFVDENNGTTDNYYINGWNGYNLPVRVAPQRVGCPTINCYGNGTCDANMIYMCPTGGNYVITFCP